MVLQVAYVDRDEEMCERFQRYFSGFHHLHTYHHPDPLLRALREKDFHVVLAQEELAQLSGPELLCQVEKTAPQVLKILLTNGSSTKNPAESGYLAIPFKMSRKGVGYLCQFLEKLLLDNPSPSPKNNGNQPKVVFASADMYRQLQYARQVADVDAPLLITGDTGTGKDLLASYVHHHGHRQNHRLHVVNCAAISEALFESAFFGHVKGAFTGADSEVLGHFRRAHLGTLVLDEIGELQAGQQAKLLRAIDNMEAYPVGSSEVIRFDTRVIALTNRDIQTEIRSGRFRADLFHRLSAFQIHLKPLNERREDILPLVDHFLENSWYSLIPGRQRNIAADARHLLEILDYPGNVRDLRNLVHQLLASKSIRKPRITRQDIEILITGGTTAANPYGDESLNASLERIERERIVTTYARSGYNITQTARELGLTRSNLRRRMQRLGIEGGK